MTIDLSNTTLYSINQVCEKLGVSRSTLDRWRGVSKTPGASRALGVSSTGQTVSQRLRAALDATAPASPAFPEPDTYLNDSPRWTIQTLNKWVNANSRPRPGLNIGVHSEPEE